MRLTTNILIVLSVFVVCACESHESRIEKKYLKESLSQLNFENSYKWIVIIPGAGCHGCIQEGEYFMQKNVGNKDVLFILTNLSSVKVLQHKISIKIKECPNVYVDREGIFNVPTKNAIYPCVIYLKNSAIDRIEFQSPGNSALKRLKKNFN